MIISRYFGYLWKPGAKRTNSRLLNSSRNSNHRMPRVQANGRDTEMGLMNKTIEK